MKVESSPENSSEFYNSIANKYHQLTDGEVEQDPDILLNIANVMGVSRYFGHKLDSAAAYTELFTRNQMTGLYEYSDLEIFSKSVVLLRTVRDHARQPDQWVRAATMLVTLDALKKSEDVLGSGYNATKRYVKDLQVINQVIIQLYDKTESLDSKARSRLIGVAHEVTVLTLLNAWQLRMEHESQVSPLAWPAFSRHDQKFDDEYSQGDTRINNFDIAIGKYADIKGKLQVKSRPYWGLREAQKTAGAQQSVSNMYEQNSSEQARSIVQNSYGDDICVVFADEDFNNSGLETTRMLANWLPGDDPYLPPQIESVANKLAEKIQNYYSH